MGAWGAGLGLRGEFFGSNLILENYHTGLVKVLDGEKVHALPPEPMLH